MTTELFFMIPYIFLHNCYVWVSVHKQCLTSTKEETEKRLTGFKKKKNILGIFFLFISFKIFHSKGRDMYIFIEFNFFSFLFFFLLFVWLMFIGMFKKKKTHTQCKYNTFYKNGMHAWIHTKSDHKEKQLLFSHTYFQSWGCLFAIVYFYQWSE